jgi:mannose-6-phosphate isomerase
MQSIYLVNGVVKNYEWGGNQYLPALLGHAIPQKQPFAEYWMGTHPQGIAQVVAADGSMVPLLDKTGPLPFLLKVLDVADMLSIQVHPTKAAAAIEFELENKKGIALTSPLRNYKDRNHKPELMVALSSFWLLHGFKTKPLLDATLQAIQEFAPLRPVWQQGGIRGLYEKVMMMQQPEVDQLLLPLLARITPLYEKELLRKESPDYWAARAGKLYGNEGHADRGIFSIYFFNLVHVNPGEAVFQDAGIPHAYLEGQNVEIMANSDNVLRGGLTPKHVDVQELMKHTRFKGVVPTILHPQEGNGPIQWFETPVDDFRLGMLRLKPGIPAEISIDSPGFLLTTGETVELSDTETQLQLKQGQLAAFWDGISPVSLTAMQSTAVYIATKGIHNG